MLSMKNWPTVCELESWRLRRLRARAAHVGDESSATHAIARPSKSEPHIVCSGSAYSGETQIQKYVHELILGAKPSSRIFSFSMGLPPRVVVLAKAKGKLGPKILYYVNIDPKVSAAATKVLYAIALEIVLVCPLRRDNVANLRLDTHLIRANTRGRPITDLWIDATDVKNGREIAWSLPEGTVRLIQMYIDRYRPLLLDGTPNNHLFPGAGGASRNAVEFGTALSELITIEIGAEVNIHLLRHFAAWRYLNKNPGAYEIVRLALGHASTQTVIRAYAGLEADAATAHLDENLLQERRETQATAAALFGRRRGRPAGSRNKPKAGGRT